MQSKVIAANRHVTLLHNFFISLRIPVLTKHVLSNLIFILDIMNVFFFHFQIIDSIKYFGNFYNFYVTIITPERDGRFNAKCERINVWRTGIGEIITRQLNAGTLS